MHLKKGLFIVQTTRGGWLAAMTPSSWSSSLARKAGSVLA